jgi:hypothetical protein
MLEQAYGKMAMKKSRSSRGKKKVNAMLEVFFDAQGLVHYEFIPE